MNATLTNGRARKSLNDQLDRLDSILDGLSEALQEAVGEAVQAAVKAVLNEILAKPEVLAKIAEAQGVTPVVESRPKSEWLARTWNRTRSALRSAGRQIVKCRVLIGRTCDIGLNKIREAGRQIKAKALGLLIAGGCSLLQARRFVGPVVAAVALGGLTGVAACYLDPWITGAVSAVGGLGIALRPTTSNDGWFARGRRWKTEAE